MTDAETLALIDAGIAAVLTNIAAGKVTTEYRIGAQMVRKESPTALLAELRRMRAEVAARAASNDSRACGMAVFGGDRP